MDFSKNEAAVKREKENVILETERLYLRELKRTDFEALCKILQDEETMYAYEGAFCDAEVQEWLDRQISRYQKWGFGLWAVVLKETDEVIGQCGLTMQPWKDREVLEIGYLFRRSYWQKGYATEAAKACREYAFEVLNADEVCSIIRDTNVASQKVAVRNGMKVQDRWTKHYRGVDMPHDRYVVMQKEKDNMRVLCYGDSNTWGFRPMIGGRYGKKKRWTGRLEELTGYEIIEEGLNGRTTVFSDYLEPYRNGLKYAAPCILSHLPLDVIIVMLGSNDAKRRYHVTAPEIARGLGEVIRQMRIFCERKGAVPDILIVAPPRAAIPEGDWDFGLDANQTIAELEIEYEKLARELGCDFLKASDYVDDIGADGLHMTARGHEKLADGMAEYLRKYGEKSMGIL